MKNRTLYFGDNLEILRDKFLGDEGYFDLIYLDPPFSSNRNYNVLYREGIIENHAQIQAFEDTWHWTQETEKTFEELVGVRPSKTEINQSISDLMGGFQEIIGKNDVMAYLVMMAIRLIELHRVLKPAGSLYLHCDPTVSHYLKIVLDVIFDKKNFRNEIIWKRTNSPKSQTEAFGTQHDIVLFYTKSDKFTFNKQVKELEEISLKPYQYKDKKGIFRLIELEAHGIQKYAGRKQFEWQGRKACWLYTKDKLDGFWNEGLIYKTGGGDIVKNNI